MLTLLVFCVIVVFGTTFTIPQIPQPTWADQFKISFYQWGSDQTQLTNGMYWTNFKFNHTRIDRQSGKYEPLCASLMPNVTTPCTHLINNGTKFIVLPQKSLCCQCCKISDPKCFFINQNWLQNATYKGIKSQSWQFYYGWSSFINGIPYDYWGTMDSSQYPKKIINYNINFDMNFDPYTYNATKIPDSVFVVPNYCNRKCPSSNYCN